MKRFFLLTLCIVALSACSDDKTAGNATPAVVGDVQFAAAIDPVSAESRIVHQGSVISWEPGDKIGITAMIDGTPYIENIPYTLSDATSFSMLEPAAEAIRWNESVTGQRTYFAYYPYDQTNAGGLLNRAVVRFSVSAEQHVVAGVNTVQPFLIGQASTSAMQQQPVALRFRNFASVLELHFESLDQTTISVIEIAPSEGSALTGWMTAEGTTDNLGNVTLTGQSDRLKVFCDGLTLDQPRTVRIPIGRFTTQSGGITINVVTTDEQIFSETLFADVPFASYVADDDDGSFVSGKYIAHKMAMEVISDVIGEEYFSDDFNWITPSDRWNDLVRGGWPTVSTTNSPTGKANYFTLDLLADFARIGYTASSAYRTSVQARYEGYVCLGISSKRAALTTPALEKIGTTPTDLLVSFYGAAYASATKTPDTEPIVISVAGPGTIGDTDRTSTEVSLTNSFCWRKYWVIVKGATAETRIVFGKDEAKSNARVLIDNILIGKAMKNAEAGSRDIAVTVEPKISFPEGTGTNLSVNNLAGAEASLIVQATTAWSLSSDADWLSVDPTIENLGTGMPYTLTFRALSQNTSGETRTATITVTAGDQTTATITVVQSNVLPQTYFEDNFDWTQGDGTMGGIQSGKLDNTTDVGKNGTKFTNWSEAYKSHGWTCAGGYVYAKNGVLGLGITSAIGDIRSPKLELIGATPTDVVVEYDILEYPHASETGKSVFTVSGDGKILSIGGNYTQVANDTYTGIAANGKSCNYYCGNYGDWSKGAQWHRITVVVSGATSQTQIGLSGNGKYSRFLIDNFEVSPKK